MTNINDHNGVRNYIDRIWIDVDLYLYKFPKEYVFEFMILELISNGESGVHEVKQLNTKYFDDRKKALDCIENILFNRGKPIFKHQTQWFIT